jgi:D-alanyl-D-alanine carboxypeptidase/D-alanyl-D-alanine-endopeptidase (penicillin-binding protein 4)
MTALSSLSSQRVFQDAEVGLQVVDVASGSEVYGWQADKTLAPASVMKAVTSAVALTTLGPAFRYLTTLSIDGSLSAEGVLKGNLYVKGSGDPTMVVERLWKLFADLRVAGITRIEGDVIFDDSVFDNDHQIAGWTKKQDLAAGPAYFAPLGGLSVNQNAVAIVVVPNPAGSGPAQIRLDTPSTMVELDGDVRTVAAGRKSWTRVDREILEDEESMKFTVRGEIAADAWPQYTYRAVSKPLPWFMGVVRDLLSRQGVAVKGRFREGMVPENSRDLRIIASQNSDSLAEMLATMNKQSSNIIAESVLKSVGAKVYGGPGTTEKGTRAIAAYLDSIGVPKGQYTLVNGSGLSPEIRLRPSTINAVLVDMYKRPALAPEYLASMAVAGVDGTLKYRKAPSGLEGRVRGKTGTINGVYCLAGYVTAADGRVYAFSVLVNGNRRNGPVRALQDSLTGTLLSTGAVIGSVSEGEEEGDGLEE